MNLKKLEGVDHLVVHCAATPPTHDWGVREIDAMHRKQGWLMIGYHFVIRRNGYIEIGRPRDRQGAHVGHNGHNRTSLGICLIGGTDANGKAENNFTTEQFASLKLLLAGLQSMHPDAQIVGHRDLSPDLNGDGVITSNEWIKECPSFDVIPWAKSVGLKV
jgi:N-acetylmuramoyl-L-alanine amidase